METGADAFGGTQRFEVLEQLGAGSMCVVYKVLDRRHGDVVALKTERMRGQAFIAFREEASAAAALRELNGFVFYGAPVSIEYARTQSNIVNATS